jgi:hypothetical protein
MDFILLIEDDEILFLIKSFSALENLMQIQPIKRARRVHLENLYTFSRSFFNGLMGSFVRAK